MKALYLDLFSGLSGDMMLGALLDAAGGEDVLRAALSALGIDDEFSLEIKKIDKMGVAATSVTVLTDGAAHGRTHERHARHEHHQHKHHDLHEHEHHEGHDHHEHEHQEHEHHEHEHHGHAHGRSFADIRALIETSALEENVKRTALRAFTLLAQAEGRIHGRPADEVTFHEVGAVDSIVDTVGACILLNYIAPDVVIASPVNVGSGLVRCAHGVYPVPAPATAALMTGAPIYQGQGRGELLTPTGAALLQTFVTDYGPMPPLTAASVGYGAGKRDMETLNCARIFIGTLAEAQKKTP